MENEKPECSVLVTSCDAYFDLWEPFFNLFWENWPDCPYPVFLSTNHREFQHPRVMTLRAGRERNWTNQLRCQLERLDTPYVLMSLEDFFLRRPVSTIKVQECLHALSTLHGHMLRLVCRPGPDRPVSGHPGIGSIDPGAPYRVSTQAAIWNRQSLLTLLREDESIWDFEIRGSDRSREYITGFYGVRRNVLTYGHHVIERGKWFPWEARKFGRADIGCDFEARAIMTPQETGRWCLGKARSLILNSIPWKLRLRLIDAIRRPARHVA
jgi:hypothetical protein